MSETLDLDKVEGFFHSLYVSIEKSCTPMELQQFATFDNDDDRINFMLNLKAFKELQFTPVFSEKSDFAAQNFKTDGNTAFLKKNWQMALDFYNNCVLMTPTENEDKLSIALANRSAALYHLEKYDLALRDIALAEKNYPKEMMYKLKERAARCHLALKNYEPAVKSFKETIICLDESKLPLEKHGKLEKDAQIMIKMLPRQIELQKSLIKNANQNVVTREKLHQGVTFEFNEYEGRYACAEKDIKVGEEVLCEKAHCAALLQRFSKTHCQHCFNRTMAPIPCATCTNVIFCSTACQTQAHYHRYECCILPIIWSSGSSINCHMALRIISQKSLQYFNDMKDELKSGRVTYENTRNLPSDDYRKVFVLIRHENERTCKGFFQYSLMSCFLAYCLKVAGYFENALNMDDIEDIRYIAFLISRNLQFIQFNSHEIFDLVKAKSGKNDKTVFIGGGLYSTLALFNHSCDPSIVRYFKGTTVYVHAIRNIRPGISIGENYGPLYTQNPKIIRQSNLKEQYWFECNCHACMENWPTYDEMTSTEIRFKCDGGSSSCNNVIAIPSNCNEFMIQCIQCGQYTNILKGLKAVQDTEILQKTASRLYSDGSVDKALKKYIDMMNIIDTIMAPPFQDYCNCQQSIKDCLLEYGNRMEVD